MRRKALVWKLFPVYFIITLASVLIVSMYAIEALREFYHSQLENDLEVRARLIGQQIADERLLPGRDAELARLVESLSTCCGTRVTVIAPDGDVVADSQSNAEAMENHSDRPEFRAALAGQTGAARRRSPTLGVMMVYAALPIEQDGRIIGVLRTSLAATAIDAEPSVIYYRVAAGTLLIALLAGVASLLAASRISSPLQRMKEAASRFANGDFRSRVPLPDTDEMASLADTLNRMAAQLDSQVRTSTQHASEQQAILSSMKEGVVAIGNDDRIIILNPTAEEMLGVELQSVKGKTIQEAIRNPNLQRFFEQSYHSETPTADEIMFHAKEDRLVQAIGTALLDADGKRIGVLVVLNDISQTRKLESIRKDFVANVSHELKTPITSIKGFVETLREGAMDDPRKAREFLDIVARQADRLNAIIEDLLTLSKIEQRAETAEIRMEHSPVCDVLRAALANCQPKASETGVNVSVECDNGLMAMINAPLLEQAVTNLLDNAIKYSPAESEVRMSAERSGRDVVIHVIDNGQGIEPEHIPRLFERFYRVDKARSRKMGGTGLGLAIVKHIVQAHQGRIGVQSTPGKGSKFSIFLRAESLEG